MGAITISCRQSLEWEKRRVGRKRHEAGCTKCSIGEPSICTTKALLLGLTQCQMLYQTHFQETDVHLTTHQHLTHTTGHLSAKKARVAQSEAAGPQVPAHAAQTASSGSWREPPPGQQQNCSSKLSRSIPAHKKHDCRATESC